MAKGGLICKDHGWNRTKHHLMKSTLGTLGPSKGDNPSDPNSYHIPKLQ